jgi:hypothetical protein
VFQLSCTFAAIGEVVNSEKRSGLRRQRREQELLEVLREFCKGHCMTCLTTHILFDIAGWLDRLLSGAPSP